MTPEQKIKHMIINLLVQWKAISSEKAAVTAENIDEIYQELDELGHVQDARNDIRQGEVETNIPCEDYSRHYEAKSVAAKAPDGSWVGWTYWYGGGKHSNPEEMEWMDSAYNLTCAEKKKVVLVRTFTKVE